MDKFKKDPSLLNGKGEWNESKHPRDSDGKFVKISEFRYLENHPAKGVKPHPAHLYAKSNNDKVKYHQLTHSKQIKNSDIQNVELLVNPNKKDKRRAYFIPKSEVGNFSSFGKRKKNWKLSDVDNDRMKKFRDFPFGK